MSSGINSNRDMAYVGEKPWHGLGSVLQKGASIERWTEAAGMDWTINSAMVRYQPMMDDGRAPLLLADKDKKVVYRSDTNKSLGVVGTGFQIVQPKQVLEFFRDLTEKAGFELETAGCLFGGKRFWALAKTGEGCEIVPGDVVREYLLLCTGADGSLSTTGKYVAERVVCNNTLSLALGEKSLQHKISHRSVFDPKTMRKALMIDDSILAFDNLATTGRRLADKFVSGATARGLAMALLASDKVTPAMDYESRMAALDKIEKSSGYRTIVDLFEGQGKGATLDGVRDTAWGFLNAVTEYADHHMRAKSDDHRLNRVIEGDADGLKAEALRLLEKV